MRSVTLTLNEEEVHRLYMALHCKIDAFKRLAEAGGDNYLSIPPKYQAVLDRISAAYREILTEENHVGSTDPEEDRGDV
jgi:hypothetical protein